jgi:hypothetical protein
LNKIFVICFCLSLCLFACKDDPKSEKEPYLRWVGDIPFDENIDDPDFKLCFNDNDIRQYFNFSKGVQYKGEKPAIDEYFKEKYQAVESNQSGLIRIRFIVNCKGETDRFRLMAMDGNYQATKFSSEITDQLLDLTQKMDGWLPIEMEEMNNTALDYYQYIIFKIDRGNIIEIMP